MLLKRVLAALVFAPALLFLLICGGQALEIACLLLAVLMLGEFAGLVLAAQDWLIKIGSVALGTALAISTLGWMKSPSTGALVIGGAMALWVLALLDPDPMDQSMHRVGIALSGAVYGGTLIMFVARLRTLNDGMAWSVMAVFGTWAADTAAYFVGHFWGHCKLYPKVSPGKTVEGLAGSIVGAIAAVFLIRSLFRAEIGVTDALVLGLIAGVIGVVGDLAESLLKRSVGAKDSSHIIPGHGGILDRFDGVLFVAPAMYCYCVWVAGK
jgi:phosphatidate cytidylyltransferase